MVDFVYCTHSLGINLFAQQQQFVGVLASSDGVADLNVYLGDMLNSERKSGRC